VKTGSKFETNTG